MHYNGEWKLFRNSVKKGKEKSGKPKFRLKKAKVQMCFIVNQSLYECMTMLLHKLRQSGRNMIDRPNKVRNNRDLNSF